MTQEMRVSEGGRRCEKITKKERKGIRSPPYGPYRHGAVGAHLPDARREPKLVRRAARHVGLRNPGPLINHTTRVNHNTIVYQ